METVINLIKAFLGESQARNRYTFYAKIARKEGFEQIAGIFQETADQEKEHAKRLFEHIQELKGDKEFKIETEVPLVYGTTEENLEAAAKGENFETSEMYPSFANKAEEENLPEIAKRLRAIAKAEAHHEERYQKLLKNLREGKVFEKDEEVEWVCRECGYPHKGKSAPEKCPSCDHAQAFYQLKSEEF